MTDCTDVCDIVVERLHALGFKVDNDDESHDDILNALVEVEFVRTQSNGKGSHLWTGDHEPDLS